MTAFCLSDTEVYDEQMTASVSNEEKDTLTEFFANKWNGYQWFDTESWVVIEDSEIFFKEANRDLLNHVSVMFFWRNVVFLISSFKPYKGEK